MENFNYLESEETAEEVDEEVLKDVNEEDNSENMLIYSLIRSKFTAEDTDIIEENTTGSKYNFLPQKMLNRK